MIQSDPSFSSSAGPLLERAEALACAGRIEEADCLYRRALSLDAGFGPRLEFGRHLFETGRIEGAIAEFSQALNWAQSAGNVSLVAAACTNLAAAHRELGRIDEAARWQQLALSSTARGTSLQVTQGIDPADLAGLANDALLRQEFEMAERLWQISIAAEYSRENLSGAADDLASMGVISLLKGDLKSALVRMWRAYRLHRRVSDDIGCGRDLLNLAELCRKAGRHRIGIRCLRTAIRLFERRGAGHLAERARALLDDAQRILDVRRRDPLVN